MRWSPKLKYSLYIIWNVPGENITWAYMLKLWETESKIVVPFKKTDFLKALMTKPIRLSLSRDMDWTTNKDLNSEQIEGRNKMPERIDSEGGFWRNSLKSIFIRPGKKDLKLRILTTKHNGIGGHRGW